MGTATACLPAPFDIRRSLPQFSYPRSPRITCGQWSFSGNGLAAAMTVVATVFSQSRRSLVESARSSHVTRQPPLSCVTRADAGECALRIPAARGVATPATSYRSLHTWLFRDCEPHSLSRHTASLGPLPVYGAAQLVCKMLPTPRLSLRFFLLSSHRDLSHAIVDT